QADPRVAASRLNDGIARLEHAFAFGRLDHAETNPILHTAARIERFELAPDDGAGLVDDPIQSYGWGTPDQVEGRICDDCGHRKIHIGHMMPSQFTVSTPAEGRAVFLFPGALGDFLCLLPALAAFRRRVPRPPLVIARASFNALLDPSRFATASIDHRA